MNIIIDDKTFEPFIESEMIEKRIRLMGIQMNLDYEHKIPVFIGVLNGAFMFIADLMKEIHIGCEIGFVKLSSYHGDTKSSGKILEDFGLSIDLKDRDVVLLEDIVDTGETLKYLLGKIKALEPASVKVATLLLKPNALKYKFDEIDFIGFEIANDFVVGYGLDYKNLGRNLDDIYRVCE
jgi:hypoxanthine phosphoribosyltransferase